MDEKERVKKNEEILIESKNFFEMYKKEIGEYIRRGKNVIEVNFLHLTEFSNKISEDLLTNPEDILRLLEMAIEESGLVKNSRVRLVEIPETHLIKIRNIRSKNLNGLVIVEGIVRQASDVRPQVVNAKFECPSCGRRGGFKPLSKEMVDTQRLVIEESPESLTGGEQPKRINVFLKEDLV